MFSLCTFVLGIIMLSLTKTSDFIANNIIVITSIILQSIALYVDIARNKILFQVKSSLYVGYIIRIVFLFFIVYGEEIFILPNTRSDAIMYFCRAELYATSMNISMDCLFAKIYGTIFHFTGSSLLYGSYLNVIISMLSLCIFTYTLKNLEIKESARKKAVTILAILPNYAMLSASFVQETIVAFFSILALSFFVSWMKKGKLQFFVLAIVCVLVGSMFHMGVIGIVGGATLVLLFYD